MEAKKAASFIGLLAVTAMLLTPAALAFVGKSPINPNLTWNPNPVNQGATTTATYGVAADSDCVTGDTFAGTLTVVEPDGVSTSTVIQGATPCGTTNLSAVYPTAFTGTASTRECGLYTATWAGSTSTTVGGVHPKFSTQDNFIVQCATVPEFGAPAMLLAAFGMVLVVAMKKGNLLRY
jgi:hypothetical protein